MAESRPPPKMANFGGVYFLTFFQKNTLSPSKLHFLVRKSEIEKCQVSI